LSRGETPSTSFAQAFLKLVLIYVSVSCIIIFKVGTKERPGLKRLYCMRNNLFVPGKMDYVKGKERPNVDCILCAIVKEDDNVARLEVHRTRFFVVALNLYPYAPGHLIVFPQRHITDLRELNDEEILEFHKLQGICLDALESVYAPKGFNVGYNMGDAGGASIAHLHLHIVPRYMREVGFIDIISGTKIIIEDPNVSLSRMREAFTKIIGSSSYQ